MINYIWSFMIILSVGISLFTNRTQELNNGITTNLNETLQTILSMTVAVCFWNGMIKIAENSGLIDKINEKIKPILERIFITNDNEVLKYVGINILANMIGIGSCALPAGIKAFQRMQKLNSNKVRPSNDMCMFLLINISSVQLFSMNLLMQREQYGSINPSVIVMPGIIATIGTTLVAICTCMILRRFYD